MSDGWHTARTSRRELVDVALGRAHADLAIVGGTVVNVHTGRLLDAGVAIKGDRIAAVGEIAHAIGPATQVLDAAGRWVTPGLIAAHMHHWHSNHNGTVFAECLLRRGTTAFTDGFYGPGTIAGQDGVRFFLEEIARTPVKPIFLVPTHSYAKLKTLGFDPPPRALGLDDLLEMLEWPAARGVEETGVDLLVDPARADPGLFRVLERALELGKVTTGHGVVFADDRELNAWAAAGIMNNHEATTAARAQRELDAGLHLLLRDAPGLRNMAAVAPVVADGGTDTRAVAMCPDIAWPDSLFEGHMDETLRAAIRAGVPPVAALQMATLQVAEFFRVNHDVGSVAPGRIADVVLLGELESYAVDTVVADGVVHVEGGELRAPLAQPEYPRWMYETVRLARRVGVEDVRVPAPCAEGAVQARVIDLVDGEFLSREAVVPLPVRDGQVLPDPERGIAKVVVADRLSGSGDVAVGFVRGFGLHAGAMGSAANPTSQAICVVGVSDRDVVAGIDAIAQRGGAFVAVRDGAVTAELPTPLLGIASDLPAGAARSAVDALVAAWRELGCAFEVPFAYLEFVVASTEPVLRMSTKGLMRVDPAQERRQTLVPVVV